MCFHSILWKVRTGFFPLSRTKVGEYSKGKMGVALPNSILASVKLELLCQVTWHFSCCCCCCWWLFVVCCLGYFVCCFLFVVGCLLLVVCCWLFVFCVFPRKCMDSTLEPPYLIITEFLAGGSLFDFLYNSLSAAIVVWAMKKPMGCLKYYIGDWWGLYFGLSPLPVIVEMKVYRDPLLKM